MIYFNLQLFELNNTTTQKIKQQEQQKTLSLLILGDKLLEKLQLQARCDGTRH